MGERGEGGTLVDLGPQAVAELVQPVQHDVPQVPQGRLALQTHPDVPDRLEGHDLDGAVLGLDHVDQGGHQGGIPGQDVPGLQMRHITPELDQT